MVVRSLTEDWISTPLLCLWIEVQVLKLVGLQEWCSKHMQGLYPLAFGDGHIHWYADDSAKDLMLRDSLPEDEAHTYAESIYLFDVRE